MIRSKIEYFCKPSYSLTGSKQNGVMNSSNEVVILLGSFLFEKYAFRPNSIFDLCFQVSLRVNIQKNWYYI